jgi:molybdate transport system substrate-binding protein
MLRSRVLALLAALLILPLGGAPALAQGKPVTVFAAASLTDAMQTIGAAYKKKTGAEVRFSFASSSTLARQIESGAPAEVFVSADREWMDYVQARKLIRNDSRRDILGNRLVLIAPASSTVKLKIAPGFDLAAALGQGRLAVGDPAHVPAGLYAKAALTRLGAWDPVQDRLAPAENVRAALAYVARGEASLGIVYWTDALSEPKVRIVATFPEASHPPITYLAALTVGSTPAARGFYDYLRGPEARAVFKRLGFSVR